MSVSILWMNTYTMMSIILSELIDRQFMLIAHKKRFKNKIKQVEKNIFLGSFLWEHLNHQNHDFFHPDWQGYLSELTSKFRITPCKHGRLDTLQ